MSGDYSRNTYRPEKAHSLVRMQQGRLFTDADWNEQGEIQRRATRVAAHDIIGHFGVPTETPEAFAIQPDAATDRLLIGGGRAWIAGREVHSPGPVALTIARISGSGANKIWRVSRGPALPVGAVILTADDGTGTAHIVTGTDQDENEFQTITVSPTLGPNNRTEAWYQPSVQSQPFAPLTTQLPNTAGTYLAYLTVWDQPVTALDDPDLRDVAWDGPDTATRDAVHWQVSVVDTDDLIALGQAAAPVTCADFADGLSLFPAAAAPLTLAARARLDAAAPTPCTLTPDAEYTSLVNHLYRVEIIGRSALGAPHLLWSRDNAMHRARLLEIDAGRLVVDSVGKDDLTALGPGDWVEIRDRDRVMAGQAGLFARIAEVSGTAITIDELRDPDTLALIEDNGAPDTDVIPVPAILRRWEGGLPQPLPAPGAWLPLENGVEVLLEGDVSEPGAFWTVPARTVTGDVDWPRHPISGEPELRAPEGPGRVHAALALLDLDAGGSWTLLSDCRPLFPPLTEALDIHYVSGDGQAVAPDPTAPGTRVPVPQDFAVAAVRGDAPVAGVSIRFRVTAGSGLFADNTSETLVQTGPDGVASVAFLADAVNDLQTVSATQVDTEGAELRTPVVFAVSLRRAALTSFDPAQTPALAGATEVQTAIELLAQLAGRGCATHVILPGMDWAGILGGIAAGTDVNVCFAPGTYETPDEVVMANLGHVKITGSGAGVHLIGRKTERTLTIQSCQSVIVRDIYVDAPDDGMEFGGARHRDGALTVRETPSVKISQSRFGCGEGAFQSRACLTIRGRSGEPLDDVLVEGCDFEVGHLQEALLLHDNRRARVIGNQIFPRPRQGQGIPGGVIDKKWRDRLVDVLVANPRFDPVVVDPDLKSMRAGSFLAVFPSALPQAEWDALIAKVPPGRADLQSMAAFQRFTLALIDNAAREPSLLPSLAAAVSKLGSREAQPELVRALAVGGEPKVRRAGGLKKGDGAILLSASGHQLTLNSPVSQRDWTRALRAVDSDKKVTSAEDLLSLSREVAGRFISEPAFREPFPTVTGWFTTVVTSTDATGFQGIVCAGEVQDEVHLRDNRIEGVSIGIRVATSNAKKTAARFHAGSVDITGNRLHLRPYQKGAYIPFGLFVGNVNTLRITRNDIRTMDGQFYPQGIRIWGFLGQFILCEANRIGVATMGFRVKDIGLQFTNEEVSWKLLCNVVTGKDGNTRLHQANPAFFMEEEGNRVFEREIYL